ncbi:MAG: hypothetical protein AAGU78_10660 [Chloroflexota bacterium]|nr:hypothetical protein [Anaerolineae bacterium]
MRAHPQRLAWVTILSGLLIFCLLCISTVIVARWFVFDSPTELSVRLHVGRGTVGLAPPDDPNTEQAIRAPSSVARGSRMTTDNEAQGYLSFADPYSGETVAIAFLRSNTQISLVSANRPRFNLSENPYTIRLGGLNGRLEVWVNSTIERPIQIEVDSPFGLARISEGGSYLVESMPGALSLNARAGGATLISPANQTQHVAAGNEATILAGSQEIRVGPGPIDLLPNSLFGESEDWPKQWGCAFFPSPDDPNGPPGQFPIETVDGRRAYHLYRLQPDAGPGETGCQQSFGGNGLNVISYDSVRLRVMLRVDYQEISACGEQGSECAVMLRMAYEDRDGNDFLWVHGFYAEITPNVGRTTCDTCLEPHEQINKQAWYVYESPNLLIDLPQDRRPAVIEELRFTASGHKVDVFIGEVSLIAERNAPAGGG